MHHQGNLPLPFTKHHPREKSRYGDHQAPYDNLFARLDHPTVQADGLQGNSLGRAHQQSDPQAAQSQTQLPCTQHPACTHENQHASIQSSSTQGAAEGKHTGAPPSGTPPVPPIPPVGAPPAFGAITVQKTINIAVRPEEAYDYWGNPERLPRVLSHVREVRRLNDHTYHWVVEGPGSIPIEWDAEVTEDVPGHYIAWRTLPGSTIGHEGSVRFEPTMDGTRITVRLSYNPPAGALGHAVASLFGADPHDASIKATLLDDLQDSGLTGP